MTINDLIIGQARAVSMWMNNRSRANQDAKAATPAPAIDNRMVGKYVIVRCLDAGVLSGVLESHNGRECVLTDSRRLWYHKPAIKSSSWYEGVSVHGLSSDSKTSEAVIRRHLTENCDIVECSDVAEKSIREAPTYGQQ